MVNQPAHLLRAYDGQGWRAMFCPGGFQHSLASHAGTAWGQAHGRRRLTRLTGYRPASP